MAGLGILLIGIVLLLLVSAVLGVYWALYRWLQRRWGEGASITLLVVTYVLIAYGLYVFF